MQDANPCLQDHSGLTSLSTALLNGRDSVVDILLHDPLHADTLLHSRDHSGRSVFHAAAAAQYPDGSSIMPETIVKMLLDKGANPRASDHQGRTPLFWALSSNNLAIFQCLAQEEKDNLAQIDSLGRSLSHYAALYNNEVALKYLLERHPEQCNQPDRDGCTPLHAAAGTGACVLRLIAHGADPFAQNHAGLTPLHYALISGHEDSATDMLVSVSGEILATPKQLAVLDRNGRTLLHFCAAQGFEKLFLLLRGAGVSDKQKDNDGNTLIHFAANFGSLNVINVIFADLHKHRLSSYITGANSASQKPLHLAAARGDVPTCQFLLENRAPSWAPDRYGCTALHYAALFCNIATLEQLLNPKEINKTDKNGATALHYAALGGDTSIVETLLSAGINLLARDTQGRTAVFYSRDDKMLLFLERLGLEAEELDKQKRNMLFTTIQLHRRSLFLTLVGVYQMDIELRDKNKATLLHQAAFCGDLWFINFLLVNTSLNVSLVDVHRRTPIHYAAAQGHSQAISRLMATGSAEEQEYMIDLRDTQGRSALDAAAFFGHAECVEVITSFMNPEKIYFPAKDGRTPLHAAINNLLDQPIGRIIEALQVFFDLNAVDRNNRSCLHRAVYNKLPQTTGLLLERGADINAQDKKGLTPLMIAVFLNAEEVLETIMEYDPDTSLQDKKGRTAEDYLLKRQKLDEGDSSEYEDAEELTPASSPASAEEAIPETNSKSNKNGTLRIKSNKSRASDAVTLEGTDEIATPTPTKSETEVLVLENQVSV